METLKKALREVVVKLRQALGIEVVDATELTTEERFQELRHVTDERKAATEVLRKRQVSSPRDRYDLEYSTSAEISKMLGVPCNFAGTHYWFWSPVLEWTFLLYRGVHNRMRILDVGCGDGTLLKKIIEMNWDGNRNDPCDSISSEDYKHRNRFRIGDLFGIDLSRAATKYVRETTKIRAYAGDLKHAGLKEHDFDLIFLSYFVDRDSDQRGTFEEAAQLLRNGKELVLEGLFPCELSDSSGVSYGTANVTKGLEAVEDIQLVVAEFKRLGAQLQRVIVGVRLVYSLDGPEVLPSYILILKKS